jgi:hypothetical protein
MKLAFVNVATEGYYKEVSRDLVKSIQTHCPDAMIFSFHRFEDFGSPSHADNPYAFKLYAIDYVRNLGYDLIVWCDSPIRVTRPIDEWIPEIERVGVYIQQDGWTIGQWANDKALEWFKVSRDEVMEQPNCYATLIGFDFRNPVAVTFFDMWWKAMEQGVFTGQWKNNRNTESTDPRCLGHRHDQTCAELTCYTLGIPLQSWVLGRYFRQW